VSRPTGDGYEALIFDGDGTHVDFPVKFFCSLHLALMGLEGGGRRGTTLSVQVLVDRVFESAVSPDVTGTLPSMALVLMRSRKRSRVPSYALCDGEDAAN
jgi:hypothetical protein